MWQQFSNYLKNKNYILKKIQLKQQNQNNKTKRNKLKNLRKSEILQ